MDSAGCCSISYTAQYHDEVFTFYVHIELLQSVMFCIRYNLWLERSYVFGIRRNKKDPTATSFRARKVLWLHLCRL